MDEEFKKEYFEKVNSNIINFGYHVTYINENAKNTPFAYSTGIYETFKIPELFISGLGPNLSQELIAQYVEKFKNNIIQTNIKIADLSSRFEVLFLKVNIFQVTEYMLSTIYFYKNQNFNVLQLVFPDLNGNFPNENNYNYDQEILGTFYNTKTKHPK